MVTAATDDSYSTDTADQMGPAAFMWPKDRVWSASMDNTAPCGSVASVGNRSDFPLSNAKVALVDQYESYNVQLSISYLSNPSKDSDFSVLISSSELAEMDRGHTCISVPDASSSVKSGQKATLQIKYTSDWEDSKNETYYACADIQYVALSDFDAEVPCFNATKTGAESTSTSTSTGSSSSASSTGSSDKDNAGSAIAVTGLFGVAVAGAVSMLLA
ncbi:hypothetical protein B0T10DRAFT_530406 [Thelonectria olida]|uniref:Copper acquisition factor BIM1-like domain-containing protein n=1 Tax=Thelonectria olida TaxID=1576542 RepID=A0A9P8W0S3_9HYPO|nr:hypothetical protein B0T10DRAFT_530406 [Thelonectria olida]